MLKTPIILGLMSLKTQKITIGWGWGLRENLETVITSIVALIKCRHISSSEDTEDDEVNDDDRLSVKVKHNEYVDPQL